MAGSIKVTDSNFDAEVLQSATPVLVDFYADWCAPCKVMSPILEELADDFEGTAKVVKLDTDANPNAAAAYDIRSIPTMMIFDGGNPVARGVGVSPKEALKKNFEQILAKRAAA